MNYPNDLKYTSDHVWAKVEGDNILIGLTDYAQDQLGDIIYVDLPSEGDIFAAGEIFVEVESGKTSSELASPFAGEVVKVNEELEDYPALLNEDCYGTWILELKADDMLAMDLMLSAIDYETSLE